MPTTFQLEAELRSASAGAALADAILATIERDQLAKVEFSEVEIMTPSFTNSLVMRLLEQHDLAQLRAKCHFVNRSPHVIDVMNRAVLRFQGGIRLSSQLTNA